MQSDAHLTAAMLAVVDALRGGVDEAQRQLERAQRIQRAIIGMAVLTLRQRDLSDGYIKQIFDVDADVLAAAARDADPMIDGVQDWQLRAEIEQLWKSVRRRASVWLQSDDVATSSDVVRRTGIDTGSWPLPIEALDTPGAEFVHQTSGQKIVVYSLQGLNGTPTIVDGQIRSWDNYGSYKVEFVSAAAGRSPLDLMSFGLSGAADRFHSQRGGGPRAAFGLIVAAIRRVCGPLPPYAEAASLDAAGPSPSPVSAPHTTSAGPAVAGLDTTLPN
jgi:hypothetical protein